MSSTPLSVASMEAYLGLRAQNGLPGPRPGTVRRYVERAGLDSPDTVDVRELDPWEVAAANHPEVGSVKPKGVSREEFLKQKRADLEQAAPQFFRAFDFVREAAAYADRLRASSRDTVYSQRRVQLPAIPRIEGDRYEFAGKYPTAFEFVTFFANSHPGTDKTAANRHATLVTRMKWVMEDTFGAGWAERDIPLTPAAQQRIREELSQHGRYDVEQFQLVWDLVIESDGDLNRLATQEVPTESAPSKERGIA